MRRSSRAAGIGLMLLAPLLWSSAGVVTRHIERAPAFEQVFWRSLTSFVFIALIVSFQGKTPWRAIRQLGPAGTFSGLMWATMSTAFLVALSLTTVANALVVMSIAPLLTAILSFIVLKEDIAMRTWVAAVAALIGMVWMFHSGFEPTHVAGMLVALIVPVASAANLIALRMAHARVDLIPAVMLGGALATLIALPFALPFSATGQDMVLLALLGVFQLGLPCALLVLASRVLSPPEIALLSLLEVILGPLWVWLGAGEHPAQATVIGGAIVLGALVLNELGSLRRKPA
ncbi:MAG: DMT family transporter [Betaproteobacteria bacterium]